MRIAIAGKGGTGKTTIAGTLARALARTGREVLAIDADTNPNLASVLGIPPDSAAAIASLPRNLMKKQTAADGTSRTVFDADTNPNLASVLGIPPASAEAIVSLPRNLMKKETLADGTTRTVFSADPEQLIGEFAIRGPDGVQLMVMGRVGHGGAG